MNKADGKRKILIHICHYPRSNLFSTIILELIIICEGGWRGWVVEEEMEGGGGEKLGGGECLGGGDGGDG